MSRIIAFVCVVLILNASERASARRDYNGYQVLDVVASNDEQVKFLRNLQLTDDELYFASSPMRDRVTQIMVSPDDATGLTKHLTKAGLTPSVSISNVQSVLDPMYERMDERMRSGKMAFDLNDFNLWQDIRSWLLALAGSCRSGFTCQLVNLGMSFENREIYVFRITKPGTGRKAVYVEGSINPSNWLSTSTTVNILNSLVTGSNTDAVRLTDQFDWHIVPVMNPDGYNYTFGGDRLWVKNRKPNGACYGTNLNYNFASYWGAEGVSKSPCNDHFCGTSAGSEPEVRLIQAELRSLASTLKATFTLNNFGAQWTFSYGYTVNHQGTTCAYTTDNSGMTDLARIAATASESVYGTRFGSGSVCATIAAVSGIAVDFTKDAAGVHNAFGVNLRGAAFTSDTNEIVPAYNEIWSGMVALLNALP